MGIGPEVVAGEIGYVFAAAFVESVVVVVGNPFVGLVDDGAYFAGIAVGIAAAYFGGAVGGAVVGHDDLEVETGFLGQNRVESGTDGVLLIISAYYDRYLGCHRMSSVFISAWRYGLLLV